MPDSPAPEAGPLVWRVAPFQTALLFLLASGCAALNLYGHPSGSVAGLTIVLGFAAVAFGVAGLRMHLIVEDEGVAVRFVRQEDWLPWAEIDRIEIAPNVRGSQTLRFIRPDGSWVDVPPSLLQPSRPTSRPAAGHLLKDVLRQVEDRRKNS